MARTGSCHLKKVSSGAESWRYGEWQEPVLVIFKACRDSAETWSYGKWQEPVLAIFKASRDSAETWSGKNWFSPLEILGSYWEWQEPVLATWSIRKLWGVARTGSCHLKKKKGLKRGWIITLLGLARINSCHFVFYYSARTWSCHPKKGLKSGKNWFLPLFYLICGKNRFLPSSNWQVLVLATWKWQELVLATWIRAKWQELWQEPGSCHFFG